MMRMPIDAAACQEKQNNDKFKPDRDIENRYKETQDSLQQSGRKIHGIPPLWMRRSAASNNRRLPGNRIDCPAAN
jgi:hypothetical protein